MNSPSFYRSSLKSARRGFTLLEMLIVLGIIALLMSFAIYNLTGFQGIAEKQKVKADLHTIKEQLLAYQMTTGSLPTTEQGLKALWSKPTIEPIPDKWHAFATEETKDPWGRSYQYLNPGKHNPDDYDIFSLGKDGLGTSDDDKDLGNWKSDSSSNP